MAELASSNIIKHSRCDKVMPLPLVSIIISSLNNETELKFTIDSMLLNSYSVIELIVIDGGSTDETIQLLNKYADKIAQIVSEPDNGIYDAWNKGLRLATGQYISFLGAGDCYAPNGLRQLVDCACANPQADFISSKLEIVRSGAVIRTLGEAWNWKSFRRYMNAVHAGSLHSRRLFDLYGEFDSSYRIAGDYDFLLRARDKLNTAYIDSISVRMVADGASYAGYRVFAETERAKLKNKTVSPLVARFDRYIAYFKRFIRVHLLG